MSKQYLSCHTIDNAHSTDIFSLAVTPNYILSASGSSAINIYSTETAETPLVQTLPAAHALGCHHIACSRDGQHAVSVGFGGEVKIWKLHGNSGEWIADNGGSLKGDKECSNILSLERNKAGEVWAIALSEEGQYLAATTYDGRINVWDLFNGGKKIRELETSGTYGMCIDLSHDGRLTASGHVNGTVYIFSNETGKMIYSLPGLVKPVRTVAFSPGGTRLAAAGDAGVIALYDVKFGEQVANLTGHSSWIFSLDWNDTGEYILTGSSDGKAKVWSIDQRSCVSTHGETGKTLWCVKWITKLGKSERFITAGASRNICLYREATGG